MPKIGEEIIRDGLKYVYIGYGHWALSVTNSTIINKDGNTADVIQDDNTKNYGLVVSMPGHQCPFNSTNVPLGADEVFLGSSFQSTLDYGVITISVSSDVDGAVDGMEVQWSNDGITVDNIDVFSVIANTPKTFTFGPASLFYRIKYTNGAIPQTKFTIKSILRSSYVKPSSHRIADKIVGDDDAELVKSVITGLGDDGYFHNVVADNNDNLRVNSFPYTFSIAEGAIQGHFSLLKFGTRTSVAADTDSIIWEGSSPMYSYLSSAEQVIVVSSSAQDDSAGTGIRILRIVGLDANFDEISEDVIMNGVTPVVSSASFIRLFRAYGVTSGTGLTNDGNISVAGNVSSTQLIYIPAGDGQTLMAIWTVPAGKKVYLIGITVSTDTNKGLRCSLRTRKTDGGVLYPWLTKYRAYVFQGENTFPFQIPFYVEEKTDIEIVVRTPPSAGTTRAGATFELWYENV